MWILAVIFAKSQRWYRDYLNQKIFRENLVYLKNALIRYQFLWVSEWGFSQMNLILTSTRASLSTTTVLALLFVRVVGLPLRHFCPTKYVESWILRGRHSSVDTNSKDRATDVECNESMVKVWSFFYLFLFCFVRKYIVLKQLNHLYILNPHSKILMLIFIKMLIIN
jgi:hypothetical protein